MKTLTKKKQRGAALMLSLWALFLLSAAIISWAVQINGRIILSGEASRALEAEAMACSGAEVALHPAVKPHAAALHGRFGRSQTYDVKITGEGGRLNINWLLTGEVPQRLEVLRKYLEVRGIDLNERDHMIDCLLDWVDPDNLVRVNGAETQGSYHPANQLLTRIEDLKKVKGWGALTSTVGWDNDFTLAPTNGIELIWASRNVLLALPGMTEPIVDRFLAYRRGPDKIEGTADDPLFNSLDEERLAFGFTPQQFATFAGLIAFKVPVYRVVSTGKSADVTRVVQMVIQKSGNVPQLITWKEL